MSITPLSGSGGIDVVWGDFSGGQIQFNFQHPTYVSHHILRVIALNSDQSGNFVGPPAGTTPNIQQEADNIATLIAACYNADTTIAAVQAFQTLSDHSGVAPYGYAFTTASTKTGTAAGASLPVPNVTELVSRGADGSKWRLSLPGFSSTLGPGTAFKQAAASTTGALNALWLYLTGQANGPAHAVKTNVVTHNGQPILLGPGSSIAMMNKRLRRHFGDI